MELEDVIIKALIQHNYQSNDIIDYEGCEYIITYSPLSIDKNTKSCMIFKDSGMLKMLNGTYVKNGKTYTTVTLTEWLRAIGKLDLYITFICYKNNITKRSFMDYKEYLEMYMLKLAKYNKKFEEYRKIFYSNYILDIDILGVSIRTFDTIKEPNVTIEKTKCNSMSVRKELTEIEYRATNNYLVKRKIPKLAIEKIGCYPVVIERNNYNKPAIAFDYGNGFVKYRFVFETNKKYRFLCNGKYTNFYHVRKNNTDTCYIIEGEMEGITASLYIEDDILCLHNTNTIPSEEVLIKELSKYKKIVVKIDKDRYEENKPAFDKIKKLGYTIIVDYKMEDENEDYNSIHMKDKLSKEIIEKINNKEI